MQSRYAFKSLEPQTYLIADRRDCKGYMLYVVDIVSPTANVALILVENSFDDARFSTFHKEVMNFNFWAKDWEQVVAVIEQLFDKLREGLDISNPVAETLEVGHQMHDGRFITYKLNKKVLH